MNEGEVTCRSRGIVNTEEGRERERGLDEV